MEKKLWCYGQNYGMMGKKYGGIPKTMELRFTKEKKLVREPKTKKR